jgi:signal transduction histidine kinase
MRTGLDAAFRRVKEIAGSIRFRITLWFVAILAIVLAAFSIFVYVQQARDLRSASLARLETRFAQVQALVQIPIREIARAGPLSLPSMPSNTQPLLRANDVMAITDPSGQVLQAAGPLSLDTIDRIAQSELGEQHNDTPRTYSITPDTEEEKAQSSQYLFLFAPVTLGDHVIAFIVMGSPIDPDGQLRRLVLTLILGSVGTLVVALGGGFWLADRAMRPVNTITQAARIIGETDLSRRLNLGRRDELGELADTFDGMLERLQAAFDRQRRFTADASHELRTPLTIINLEATRASQPGRSPDDVHHALGVIRSENEFMTRLVNNLLTLSRMDSGQTALSFEPVDLSDVALEGVERLAPLAARRDVTIETGDLPETMVLGDRQVLTQMVNNLIENGIKYTGDSVERVVRVETSRSSDGEAQAAVLRVSDSGVGIAPEHVPHLFERFYQADRARTRDIADEAPEAGSSGVGLGLSIVEWIVRAHRGHVRVRSSLGQGTTFEILLPLLSES